MSYTPPLGNAINFEFVSGAYSPPPSDSIVFSFYEGGPPSERSILATGFDSSQFGQPTAFNKTRYILAAGKPSSLTFGRPIVFNRTRYLTNVTVGQTQAFGNAMLSGGLRQLLVSGIAAPSVGIAWASRSPRHLTPAGIPWNFYTNHLVGYARSVSPEGFDAARFGTRIVPESTVAYPQGFVASAISEPWVSNGRRFVSPQSFRLHQAEEVRFGTAFARDSRQYVAHVSDVNDGLSGERFGQWLLVANRNRVIAHNSTSPGALPSPMVENKARPILAQGITPPFPLGEFQRSGEVSHGIRNVLADGISPPIPSRWLVVFNDARIVQSTGTRHDAFGTGFIWNNRRTITKAGDLSAAAYGVPFVSHGVRTISFDPHYSIAPPSIALPGMKLNTRYLEQVGGFDSFKTGGHALTIHWNIAYPRWTHNEALRFGLPGVRNVTPMLRQRGHDSAEFGDSSIRTQWRTVQTLELFSQAFGRAMVADRRQHIEPVAIGVIRMSDKLTVMKLQADPPAAQWVTIQSNQSIGYGALTKDNQGREFYPPQPVADHGFGFPISGAQSIRPLGIDPEDTPGLIGRPVVLYMGINDASVGNVANKIGMPAVSLRNRCIVVEPQQDSERDKFGLQDAYGKPTMDPRTIWAVVDAPDQAIANHPVRGLHPVDFVPGTPGYWKRGMGTPSIALRHRRVSPAGQVFTGYGEHQVNNRIRRIEVTGANYGIVGKPRLLAFTRTIAPSNNNQPGYTEHKFGGFYGTPTVSNATRQLAPTAIASSNRFGVQRIDLFHRLVRPQGFNAATVSSYTGSQNPYQWQHLRVGPRVPTMPVGNDMAAFGTAWVSNRVRGVGAIGFDAFTSEETFEDFALRMRVRYHPAEQRAYRLLSPQGFGGETIPHHDVGYRARYITPDGNMDNFRKGAPNA